MSAMLFSRYQHKIEVFLGAVLDHPLKIGTAVCLGRKGAVYIFGQNADIILPRESVALAELSFDGLLALVLT